MRIEKYISDLLFRYECVIVPEFGGFLTSERGASIHPFNHLFSPPYKALSFNSNLTNQDGLLANYISALENISYEEAVRLISEEVESWKSVLKNFKTVYLKNLGSFHLNYENNLVFKGETKLNYLIDSYGLDIFNLDPVLETPKKEEKKYTPKPLEMKPIKENKVIKEFEIKRRPEEEKIKKQESKEIEEEVYQEDENRFNILAIWPYAASVIVLIGLGIGAYSFFNDYGSTSPIKVENSSILPDIYSSENDKKSLDESPVDSDTQTNDFKSDDEGKEVVEDKSESVDKFSSQFLYVIVGSYNVEVNAIRKVNHIKSLGFHNSGYLTVNKNRFRVYSEKTKSFDKLQKALDNSKKNIRKDSWTLKESN